MKATKTEVAQTTAPETKAPETPPPAIEAPALAVVAPKAPDRRTNALGVAALAMGVVAAATLWMPVVGTVAMALAIAGAVLGLAGVLVAAIGKRWDLNAPIAGLVLCVTAIAVQFLTMPTSMAVGGREVSAVDARAPAAAAGVAEPAPPPPAEEDATADGIRDPFVAVEAEDRAAQDPGETAAAPPEARPVLQRVDVHTGRTVSGGPGVFMEFKNISDRPIRTFTLRVYALDAQDRPIWNHAFRPIHPDHDDATRRGPLGPNDSTSFGYALDDVGSDYAGRVRVEVERVDTPRDVARQSP
ncbi:MAG: hypothetical protein ACOC95_00420 [Planctomycetota bacterium]